MTDQPQIAFTDEAGNEWRTDATEENTVRHHGRWYLFFQAPDGTMLTMPEVRWQTRATALRTLRTMSVFELRRRLNTVLERNGYQPGALPESGAQDTDDRLRTSASAG